MLDVRCVIVWTDAADFMFHLFVQEEHSIIAEEEGIVQVPLEGHYR